MCIPNMESILRHQKALTTVAYSDIFVVELQNTEMTHLASTQYCHGS